MQLVAMMCLLMAGCPVETGPPGLRTGSTTSGGSPSSPPPTTTTTTTPSGTIEVSEACDRSVDAAVLAVCQAGHAAVVGVTGFSSVQAAIDGAADGDTVEICPGVHTEHLEIVARELDLRSVDVHIDTRLSGGGKGRPLTVLGSTVTINGLSIVDGAPTGWWLDDRPYQYGGGLFVSHTTVDLRCSTVADNTAVEAGAGMWAGASAVHIEECSFLRNTCPDCIGGGLSVQVEEADPHYHPMKVGDAPPFAFEVIDSRFEDNSAWSGGGISFRSFTPGNFWGTPTIEALIDGVTFVSNDGGDGGGGGISLDGSGSVTISSSTFESNVASGGGGAAVGIVGHVSFEDCTFEGNRAGLFGGGVAAGSLHESEVGLSFVGCAFDANEAPRGAALDLAQGGFAPTGPLPFVATFDTTSFTNHVADKDRAAIDVISTWWTLDFVDCDLGMKGSDNSPHDVRWADGAFYDHGSATTATVP